MSNSLQNGFLYKHMPETCGWIGLCIITYLYFNDIPNNNPYDNVF